MRGQLQQLRTSGLSACKSVLSGTVGIWIVDFGNTDRAACAQNVFDLSYVREDA